MPAHKGFDVHIRSEGKKLKEHAVTTERLALNDNTPVVTCYIASECGKEFGVYWDEPAKRTEMIVKVSMDGQLTDEVAHFEYDGNGASRGVVDFGQRAVRPYRFENVRTTGDESVARAGRANTKLGTILVELYKIARWDASRTRPRLDARSVVNPGYVHELDNRAGQHRVYFGPRRTLESYTSSWQVFTPVDEAKRPFMIFIFKYMPQVLLERQGIAPPLGHEPMTKKRHLSRLDDGTTCKRPRIEGQIENHASEGESEVGDAEDDEANDYSESEDDDVRESTVGPASDSEEEGKSQWGSAKLEIATIASIEERIAKLQKELAKKKAALETSQCR